LNGEGGTDKQHTDIHTFQFQLAFRSEVFLVYVTFVTEATEVSQCCWEQLHVALVPQQSISGSMFILNWFQCSESAQPLHFTSLTAGALGI
jgi:hypothetical protein